MEQKYRRTKEEVKLEFHSILKFINFNMNIIASGERDFYKQLAGNFRILFHNHGKNSKSLFNQLEIDDKIEMVSTCTEFNPNNIMPFNGLCLMRVEHDFACYGPIGIPNSFKTLSFEKWWNQETVINDSGHVKWTRKDLIMNTADKDGGSHVDPSLPMNFHRLVYQNSIGWNFFKSGKGEGKNLENPLSPCLWQIGIELFESLKIFQRFNKI
mgnify:CR=1 FL=1|tara:strand:- start:687 stop:1322 length:636 start_codon:yes stop_codon:yes gene_type:complete